MSLVAVAAFRPVNIRCVPCPTPSSDERDLLRAIQDLHRGRLDRAAEHVGRMVAGRLRQAFCRSAAAYAEALDEADVPLVAGLQLVTSNGRPAHLVARAWTGRSRPSCCIGAAYGRIICGDGCQDV